MSVINELNIVDIHPNPKQPRKYFDEKSLQELADSILKDGLQEEILVRPVDGHYEIVQGERRWRAHKIAGLTTIRVKVKEYSDDEAFHLSVIENIHRDQFAPIEEAEAFRQYVTMGFTHEQIANKISKSRDYVTSRLRLLKLSLTFQDWIAKGRISDGHAKQILKLEDCIRFFGPKSVVQPTLDNLQSRLFSDFWMKDKITVDEVKEYVDLLKYFMIVVPLFLLKGSKDIWVADSKGIPITAEFYCQMYDLHPSRITLADLEFAKKYDLEHVDENYQPWEVEKHWHQNKLILLDGSTEWVPPRDFEILNKEFMEKRETKFMEETLEERTEVIKENMAILEKAAAELGYVDVWIMLEVMFPVPISEENNVSRDTEGD